MFLRRTVKLIKRKSDYLDYEEKHLIRNTTKNYVKLIEWANNRWGMAYLDMDMLINGDAYRIEQEKWEMKYGRT
jgi:hypothetical protein